MLNGTDIADKIAGLQKEELDKFMRDRLRKRDLHEVVANLNESALSKDHPNSARARAALKRMGFAD